MPFPDIWLNLSVTGLTDETVVTSETTPAGRFDPMFASSVSETLRLTSGSPTGQLDPLMGSATGETLAYSDTASGTIPPMAASVTAEAQKSTDTVSAEGDPFGIAVTAETLAISEDLAYPSEDDSLLTPDHITPTFSKYDVWAARLSNTYFPQDAWRTGPLTSTDEAAAGLT